MKIDNLNIRGKSMICPKTKWFKQNKAATWQTLYTLWTIRAMRRLKKWQIINTNIIITSTAKGTLTKPSHCAIQSKMLKWYKAKISLKPTTPDIFTYISPFSDKRQATAFYLTTGWPLTLAVLNAGHCLVLFLFPFHCHNIASSPFVILYIQTYCQNIYIYISVLKNYFSLHWI